MRDTLMIVIRLVLACAVWATAVGLENMRLTEEKEKFNEASPKLFVISVALIIAIGVLH